MQYTFSSDRPIFLQIAEIIRMNIVSGEISPGEKLKSVREYSAEFKVNPNTVQKALAELETEGLIFTDRTNGKFVCNNDDLIKETRQKEIEIRVKNLILDLQKFKIDKENLIKLIEEIEVEDE